MSSKIQLLLTFFLFCISSYGCSAAPNIPTGKWDFYDADPFVFREDKRKNNLNENQLKQRLWDDGSENTIVLNKDKTFFLKLGIRNQDLIGHWKYNKKDSIIYLNVANDREGNKTELGLKIKSHEGNKLTLDIFSIPNEQTMFSVKKTEITFLKDTAFAHKQLYNFTAYDKNKWLIRPTGRETRAQLIERIYSSVEYVILYIKYNYTDPGYNKTVSAGSDFQRFQYFKDIGLAFRQTTRWNELFFDKEDAIAANTILDEIAGNLYEEINKDISEGKIDDYSSPDFVIDRLERILDKLDEIRKG